MRRRRKPLEVSTFPFLAVLLCTMGALILVLMVMDRRSRLVAQARVNGQLLERQAEHDRQVARRQQEQQARRQEWEKKRLLLAAQVRAEELAFDRELREVQARLAEAAHKLTGRQANLQELRRQLDREKGLLAGQEQTLAATRSQASGTAAKVTAGDETRARLAADLVRLEKALAELTAAQKRAANTYSVIPYHGKRGESRRPVYIECAAGEIVFHPDRRRLHASDDLRGELKRRAEVQQARLLALGVRDRRPYVMLLVRPDGLSRYYEIQAAARELGIDFGYEFVDADWVLRFDDDTPPPAVAVDDRGSPGPHTPGRSPAIPLGGRGAGGSGPGGGSGPAGAPGQGTSTGPVLGVRANGGGGFGGPGGSPVPGGSGTGIPGLVGGTGVPGASGPGSGPPGLGGVVGMKRPLPYGAEEAGPGGGATQGAGPALPDGSPPPSARASRGGGTTGSGSGASLGSPGGTASSGLSGGSSLFAAHGQPGPTRLPGPDGTLGSPLPSLGSPGGGSGNGSAGGGAPNGQAGPAPGIATPSLVAALPTGSAPGAPGAGAPGAPTDSRPSEPPDPATIGRQPRAGGSPGAGGAPGPRSPAAGGSPTPGLQGSGRGEAVPSIGPSLPGPKDPPPRPASLRPMRLTGEGETLIFVECQAEEVVVHPTRLRIDIHKLNHGPAYNPLLKAVTAQVQHRLNLAGPGQTPRIALRFLVHPDGRRTFQFAVAAVESLGLPMKQQLLQPWDEVARIVTEY